MPDITENMFEEVKDLKPAGMRVRTAPDKDISILDPLHKLNTELRTDLTGLRVASVATLADGPFISFDTLVQSIHSDPPGKDLIDRISTSRFGGLQLLPLLWPSTGLVTIGLCAQNAGGRIYAGSSMVLPFDDEVMPLLTNQYGIEKDRIQILLLDREKFNFLNDLVKSKTKRESHLGLLDPEKSAEQMFPQLVKAAILRQASDIHIGPITKGKLPIFFRIDGVMHREFDLDPKLMNAIVVIIKNFTEVQSIDKRRPFDARITYNKTNTDDVTLHGVDMRVSILPEVRGYKGVIRLSHGTSGEEFNIDKLALPPDLRVRIDEVLVNMNGIVLVTGPTGSGKTTTLYSMLNKINTGEFNIITIEDPVEALLPGISQIQVNHAVDLGFAEAVKRFMRQDPDAILVGEIRDKDTAEAAIQAALTGHLVFATLHTNDSFGTIARLRDLGIANSLLHETIRAVLTQRLVRGLCPDCKETYDAKDQLNHLLDAEVFESEVLLQSPPIDSDAKPPCGTCKGRGFIGRLPAAEIWVPGKEEKKLIIQNQGDSETFYSAAKASQRPIITMFERALTMVRDGETSLMECIGSTASIDHLRQHADIVKSILQTVH